MTEPLVLPHKCKPLPLLTCHATYRTGDIYVRCSYRHTVILIILNIYNAAGQRFLIIGTGFHNKAHALGTECTSTAAHRAEHHGNAQVCSFANWTVFPVHLSHLKALSLSCYTGPLCPLSISNYRRRVSREQFLFLYIYCSSGCTGYLFVQSEMHIVKHW